MVHVQAIQGISPTVISSRFMGNERSFAVAVSMREPSGERRGEESRENAEKEGTVKQYAMIVLL